MRGDYLFAGTFTDPPSVVRVDLTNAQFASVQDSDGTHSGNFWAATGSPDGTIGLFSTYTPKPTSGGAQWSSTIVKFQLTGAMLKLSSVPTSQGYGAFRGADAISDTHAVFVGGGPDSPCAVRVSYQTPFSVDAVAMANSFLTRQQLSAVIVDPTTHGSKYAFVTTMDTPGRLLKMELSPEFRFVGGVLGLDGAHEQVNSHGPFSALTLLVSFNVRQEAVVIVACGVDSSPGRVVTFQENNGNISYLNSGQAGSGENNFKACSPGLDAKSVYCAGSGGQVVKFNTFGPTITRQGVAAGDAGETDFRSAALSGSIMYVGTGTAPGRIVSFDLGFTTTTTTTTAGETTTGPETSSTTTTAATTPSSSGTTTESSTTMASATTTTGTMSGQVTTPPTTAAELTTTTTSTTIEAATANTTSLPPSPPPASSLDSDEVANFTAPGFDADVQQDLQSTAVATSSVAGIMASPVVPLTMSRAMAAFTLAGCPKAVASGDKNVRWSRAPLSFPKSLFPGAEAGPAEGAHVRMAIVSFILAFAFVVVPLPLIAWALYKRKRIREKKLDCSRVQDLLSYLWSTAPLPWVTASFLFCILGSWAEAGGLLVAMPPQNGHADLVILVIFPFVGFVALFVFFVRELNAWVFHPRVLQQQESSGSVDEDEKEGESKSQTTQQEQQQQDEVQATKSMEAGDEADPTSADEVAPPADSIAVEREGEANRTAGADVDKSDRKNRKRLKVEQIGMVRTKIFLFPNPNESPCWRGFKQKLADFLRSDRGRYFVAGHFGWSHVGAPEDEEVYSSKQSHKKQQQQREERAEVAEGAGAGEEEQEPAESAIHVPEESADGQALVDSGGPDESAAAAAVAAKADDPATAVGVVEENASKEGNGSAAATAGAETVQSDTSKMSRSAQRRDSKARRKEIKSGFSSTARSMRHFRGNMDIRYRGIFMKLIGPPLPEDKKRCNELRDANRLRIRLATITFPVLGLLAIVPAFATGMAKADMENYCRPALVVVVVCNILAAIFSIAMRPFLVPFRNITNATIDVLLALSSIIALAIFVTADESEGGGGDGGGGMSSGAAVVQLVTSIAVTVGAFIELLLTFVRNVVFFLLGIKLVSNRNHKLLKKEYAIEIAAEEKAFSSSVGKKNDHSKKIAEQEHRAADDDAEAERPLLSASGEQQQQQEQHVADELELAEVAPSPLPPIQLTDSDEDELEAMVARKQQEREQEEEDQRKKKKAQEEHLGQVLSRGFVPVVTGAFSAELQDAERRLAKVTQSFGKQKQKLDAAGEKQKSIGRKRKEEYELASLQRPKPVLLLDDDDEDNDEAAAARTPRAGIPTPVRAGTKKQQPAKAAPPGLYVTENMDSFRVQQEIALSALLFHICHVYKHQAKPAATPKKLLGCQARNVMTTSNDFL